MAGAITDLGGIMGGLIWKIVGAIGVVVVAVIIFYGIRFLQNRTKKQKSFTITAIIVDMNGVINFDMLAFVKEESSGLLEMIFKERKTDSIPPIPKHLIKNNLVMLLNYAPGHYCIIDTSKTIHEIEDNTYKIIPFNLGMKKYIVAKQREIMNKAENKKRNWELYAPWITLVVGIISAVVFGAFLFLVGAKLETANIAARALECGL